MGPVSEKIPSDIQELKEVALSFCILEAKMNNSLKRNGLYGDPKGLINGSQQLWSWRYNNQQLHKSRRYKITA